jgi:hypothetical protein
MSETPFWETAKKLARGTDYISMSVASDRARSHGWWRNLVEYGAWGGPGGTRVGPPDPESIPGIAKLFQATEEQVKAMIAADWYQVGQGSELSTRVQQLAPKIDQLNEADADLVAELIQRLNGVSG